MKSIHTLVPDIYGFMCKPVPLPEGSIEAFGHDLARRIAERVSHLRDDSTRLRLSNAGTACKRKLWYQVNKPELGETFDGATRIKFLYGDILEALLIFLAKASGHKVTHEQETVVVNGVEGHIDCEIDDHLVDTKSASEFSFLKFKAGLRPEEDSFAYIPQLASYAKARGKTEASFLVNDKSSGELTLDTHGLSQYNIGKVIEESKVAVASPIPPPKFYQDEKDGESGNRKLGFACSYCSHKKPCWPGLRTFMYAARNGYKPRFLTRVVRLPNVAEV